MFWATPQHESIPMLIWRGASPTPRLSKHQPLVLPHLFKLAGSHSTFLRPVIYFSKILMSCKILAGCLLAPTAWSVGSNSGTTPTPMAQGTPSSKHHPLLTHTAHPCFLVFGQGTPVCEKKCPNLTPSPPHALSAAGARWGHELLPRPGAVGEPQRMSRADQLAGVLRAAHHLLPRWALAQQRTSPPPIPSVPPSGQPKCRGICHPWYRMAYSG